MDVSVVAAVGSFVVSERVLKPKATVLVILGCVLAYDLTTKTHDVSSLRVYRGPALLAFTLMMSAYSLRTWRRNGVACDELLFLPGTPHGENHGIEGPLVVNNDSSHPHQPHEGDAAAGLGVAHNQQEPSKASRPEASSAPKEEEMETIDRPRVSSMDDIEDMAGGFDQWDEAEDPQDSDEGSERGCGANLFDKVRGSSGDGEDNNDDDEDEEMDEEQQEQEPLQRFRENNPQITRIGTFFFFRSSSSSTQNAAYAPSGPSVFGAALDLSMPVLFNFHLFISAYNHIPAPGMEVQAKILPLIFLSVLIVRSVFPPGRRRRFWSTVKFTAMAPFYKVRFRDAFLGDVLTSLVRPFQDILFALSYYGTVIYGMVIGSYSLTDAGHILERSWFLHNVILPCSAMLPLWWKFLQTLRQAYDAKKRWPYLGDSVKYLSAALVILYGMTHPEGRRSAWWIVSFLLSVLYQIWWDTVMDWELFVILPRGDTQYHSDCENPCCSRISSLRPSSVILPVLVYLLNPVLGLLRRSYAAIPNPDQIQLRQKRLYKNDSFYYRVFAINCLLRFTWMLCFIPAYRLTSLSGEEKVTTFSSDVNSYIGVLLPVAEILRRCLWGLLRVEMETIRMMDSDVAYSQVEEEIAMDTSKHDRSSSLVQCLPTWLDAPHQQQAAAASANRFKQLFQLSDTFKHHLFIAELSLWVVGFVMLGYWATY